MAIQKIDLDEIGTHSGLYRDRKKEKETSFALIEALSYFKAQLSVSDAQIGRFLHVPTSTVNNWIRNKTIPYSAASISNDVERLIHLLAIHRNLEAMLETPDAQQEWLEVYRADLGAVPRKLMEAAFTDLLDVRRYLDFVRGRGA